MAFESRDDLLQAVTQRVSRQAGGLTPAIEPHLEDGVTAAVLEYSRLVPYTVSHIYDGDGSEYSFALSDMTTNPWVHGLSTITKIIYPADAAHISQRPDTVDANDWMLYPDSDRPTHIRFTGITPASATANILVRYTVLHTVDNVDSGTYTPTSAHDLALEYLGSAHACELYGTELQHSTDAILEADSVDRHSIAQEWQGWAKYFRGLGFKQLGLSATGSGSAKPAGGRVDFDPRSIFGTQVWRSHRQR